MPVSASKTPATLEPPHCPVTPGPTPSGAQQDPRPGLTSGFHTGPGALCTGPPPQPCHRVPHPGTGPAPGEDHLRAGAEAEAKAWARRCTAHRGRGRPGAVCAHSSAAANERRRGRATHTAPTAAEEQVAGASLRESRACDSCRCPPGSQGRMARWGGWEGRNTVTGQAACLPTHRRQTGQPVPGGPSPASSRCRLPRPTEAPWTHLAPGLWQQGALQRGSTLAE